MYIISIDDVNVIPYQAMEILKEEMEYLKDKPDEELQCALTFHAAHVHSIMEMVKERAKQKVNPLIKLMEDISAGVPTETPPTT